MPLEVVMVVHFLPGEEVAEERLTTMTKKRAWRMFSLI